MKREMILSALCGVALLLAVYATFVFADGCSDTVAMQRLVDAGVHLYAMADGDVELRAAGGAYRVYAAGVHPDEQEFDNFADAFAAWLAAAGREVRR